jgi:hypothetical protein
MRDYFSAYDDELETIMQNGFEYVGIDGDYEYDFTEAKRNIDNLISRECNKAIRKHNQELCDYYSGWKHRKSIKISEIEKDIKELENIQSNNFYKNTHVTTKRNNNVQPELLQ